MIREGLKTKTRLPTRRSPPRTKFATATDVTDPLRPTPSGRSGSDGSGWSGSSCHNGPRLMTVLRGRHSPRQAHREPTRGRCGMRISYVAHAARDRWADGIRPAGGAPPPSPQPVRGQLVERGEGQVPQNPE